MLLCAYDSIEENLNLSGNSDEQLKIELSKQLDIHDEIEALPRKWKTELNSRTNNLSGGQKKRLDILRALLKNSDVLIFDESTSSLDPKRRIEFYQVLKKIRNNKIIIVITHNKEEQKYFDKIYEISDEKIILQNSEV